MNQLKARKGDKHTCGCGHFVVWFVADVRSDQPIRPEDLGMDDASEKIGVDTHACPRCHMVMARVVAAERYSVMTRHGWLG